MPVAEKMRVFAEKSSWIRKMFEEGARLKAEYGAENVFDFSLGNPDVPPPERFGEVLRELSAQEAPGVHAYMPNGGYPSTREALAARIGAEQQVDLGMGEVLMTCGAAGALNVFLKAVLDPGDEVVVPAPYFVEYNFYVDNHGGVTKVVRTDSTFNLDIEALEEALTPRTKVVLINSPNNPTGRIYPATTIAALAEMLERAGDRLGTSIYLVSDEPYRKIVFGDVEVPPIMAAYRNAVVVSSYSKDLSLPGERIGFLAVHPEIADKQNLLDACTLANRILGFVNAPALMQRVVERLQGVSVDAAIYARRLEVFSQVLEDAGYDFVRPEGAFYLFPKAPVDDVEFCAILQKQRILAVPGRGFGGPGYFRLAFCVDEKVIAGAAEGFKAAMEEATG